MPTEDPQSSTPWRTQLKRAEAVTPLPKQHEHLPGTATSHLDDSSSFFLCSSHCFVFLILLILPHTPRAGSMTSPEMLSPLVELGIK